MKYKKIAIIGMMGAGKSTIAKALQEKIKIKMYDSDMLFEKKFNMAIRDFFNKYSQDEFRKQETLILQEIIKNKSFILSCGGGIILSEKNRSLLFNKDIFTIYLSADTSTIFDRIKEDTTRPLLQVDNLKNEIERILNQRKKYYSMANLTISTDNKVIDEITEEILCAI